jgi:uncharacterized protein (TIRG00374 family)
MLKALAKVIFAVTIVVWLLKSGKLDFSLVPRALAEGYGWLWCFIALAAQAVLASIRWGVLLRIKTKQKIPLISLLRVTWIGLFFNCFLPGAVTGDLIKLVYAKDLDKDFSKTFLITSVLMDRVLGLMALLSILGFASALYYHEIVALSPRMESLVHFNFLLFAGAIIFLALLFLPQWIQEKAMALAERVPLLGSKIKKTLDQVWSIGHNKMTVALALAISLAAQLLSFFAFWVISHPFYGESIPLPYIFTFIPLGFMAVAVPISPAGLGVGHVIFDRLFHFAGVDGGASFFNLFFLCMVALNFLGIIPYLLSGKKHGLDEAQEFDQS